MTFAMLVLGKRFATNFAFEGLWNSTLVSHVSHQIAFVRIPAFASSAKPMLGAFVGPYF